MSSRLKTTGKGQPETETKKEVPTPAQPAATNAAPTATDAKVSRREGLRIILDNPENSPVVRQFILTTVLMFTVPFLAFFGFKYLDYAGLPIIHMYIRDRNLVGGLGAIAAVNVIIGWYLYRALTERDERLDDAGKIKKD